MSKKRKRRRRLSSSSDEDEEKSPGQDFTSSHKSVKKKCVVISQGRLERGSGDKVEKSASSDSQSPHQVKKRFCTLTKTKASNEEIRRAESRSDCAPVCSSKDKKYASKKEESSKGYKTVEIDPSKVVCTEDAGRIPPSIKTSKDRSKKKSSHHHRPSSQKQQDTFSLVLAKEKERMLHAKKECNAEKPPWTGNYSSAVGTKGSPSTSSKDAAQQNREELIKKYSRSHQIKVLEDKKSSYPDTKHASHFSTKMPSTADKNTASDNSSKGLKKHTSVSGIVKSDPQKTSSSQKHIDSLTLRTPIRFKIPKKICQKTVEAIDEKKHRVSTSTNLKRETKRADCDSHQKTQVAQVQSCLDVTPHCSFEGHDSRPSTSSGLRSSVDTNTDMCDDQMHVVEQLHLARSQRRLEVNVMESYGELTCMEIDPPEEGSTDTQYKQPHQDLIIVLDTNVLLSHLDYVKKISSEGLKGLGFPCILIPWVVLQELDSLKKGRGLSGSVSHLAIPAISYIYNSLRSRKPHVWGQSMQQAAERRNGLNAENNDDRVLQCCLQYQTLYPECALILCTNDKNLCSKALLSGVKALSKNDLTAEAEQSQHAVHTQRHAQGLTPSYDNKTQVSTAALRRSSEVQTNVQESGGLSAGFLGKDNTQLCKADEDGTIRDLRGCTSELEDCLREVLSDILEAEMKAIYDELWTEIVCKKPPWTLQDVLECLRKHWVAVFRYIFPKPSLDIVENLINFFSSGNINDLHTKIAVTHILEEARKLVESCQARSKQIPPALSVMDKIFTKLHHHHHHQESHQPAEGEASTFDVVMIDDDDNEEKREAPSSTTQVHHQEVWALFESIWTVVVQTSMEVFKALSFDTRTMQSARPAGDGAPPPPPRDALLCLHKLSATVSQLLQGFSSVLSASPDAEEVQTLLGIVQSHKISGMDSSVTAERLLHCFSHPEYR